MNEKSGSGKLLNAQQLLDQLFDAESKPSLRWLREQTRSRNIPFVRIGHLVFFDLDIVRSALAERHTNRSGLWVIEKGFDPTGANGTGKPDDMVLTA